MAGGEGELAGGLAASGLQLLPGFPQWAMLILFPGSVRGRSDKMIGAPPLGQTWVKPLGNFGFPDCVALCACLSLGRGRVVLDPPVLPKTQSNTSNAK
jgi:hypothetical protein